MAKPMTAAEIRAAMKKWKVQVREYPGWTTRKRPGAFTDIRGIIIHHTGSDAQSDGYLKWIFTEGRASEGIPAPLCQVSTDMDGDLWLGAIGRANHAGKGSSSTLAKVTSEDYNGFAGEITAGLDGVDGNAHFYGNEVRYDGGQPMTAKQYDSAVRWAAAICDHYGWSAMSVIGHREWSRRKPDPGKCPMNKFRADVAALLKAGPGGTGSTPKPPASKPTIPSASEVLQMELDDVVIGGQTPPVTVRSILAEMHWLAQGHAVGGKFEKVHASFANGGDLNNQLDRIEDDTDDGTAAK